MKFLSMCFLFLIFLDNVGWNLAYIFVSRSFRITSFCDTKFVVHITNFVYYFTQNLCNWKEHTQLWWSSCFRVKFQLQIYTSRVTLAGDFLPRIKTIWHYKRIPEWKFKHNFSLSKCSCKNCTYCTKRVLWLLPVSILMKFQSFFRGKL